MTGPVTTFPTACTGPLSGGGNVPVLPVILTGPITRLPLNSTPPVFPVRVTGPVIVLGWQGAWLHRRR